jgi:hypothetical protein
MYERNGTQRVELICPICGKTFCPAPQHAYKGRVDRNRVLLCSYSCCLEADRRHDARLKQSAHRIHRSWKKQ